MSENERIDSLVRALFLGTARDGNYHTLHQLLNEGADPRDEVALIRPWQGRLPAPVASPGQALRPWTRPRDTSFPWTPRPAVSTAASTERETSFLPLDTHRPRGLRSPLDPAAGISVPLHHGQEQAFPGLRLSEGRTA